MQRMLLPKLVRRFIPPMLLAASVQAAVAQFAAPERLHVSSPPNVLNDPVVKRCRLLAARRMDPKLNSLTAAVDVAATQFRIELVFDALATCRAALAAYPNEPKVIVAHYNVSEAVSALALGLNFPDSEEEALALALKAAEDRAKLSGLAGRVIGFFLGSAYEYGVGTGADRAAAMKWYGASASAGDPISKRELERLQSSK